MLCISETVRDLAAMLDQSDTGVLESAYRDMLAAHGSETSLFECVLGDETEEFNMESVSGPESCRESAGTHTSVISSGRLFVGEWSNL